MVDFVADFAREAEEVGGLDLGGCYWRRHHVGSCVDCFFFGVGGGNEGREVLFWWMGLGLLVCLFWGFGRSVLVSGVNVVALEGGAFLVSCMRRHLD